MCYTQLVAFEYLKDLSRREIGALNLQRYKGLGRGGGVPMAATVPCASGSQMGTSHFMFCARERATSGGPLPGSWGCLAEPTGAGGGLGCDASVWSVSRLPPPTRSERPSCEGFVDMCEAAVLGDTSVGREVEGRAVTMPRFIAAMSHADRGPPHNASQSRSDAGSCFAR